MAEGPWRDLLGKLTRGFAEQNVEHPGGRNGELGSMLVRDMTLAQAMRYHREKIWDLGGYEAASYHETGHILLGFAYNIPPNEGLEEKSYQGGFDSEIYNLEIESILSRTMSGNLKALHSDKDEFRADVLRNYEAFGPREHLNRTLGWLITQQTGKSYEELRQSAHYSDESFHALARRMRLQISTTEDHTSWVVTSPDNGQQFYFDTAEDHFLPDNIEGVHDFVRFERPSLEEIDEVYDRIQPALHLLQTRIESVDRDGLSPQEHYHKCLRVFEETKVREVYRAMMSRRISPEPEPDTQPA